MLSGFNTNVRYRGVVFHVQTEDSGRSNPHVKTHLFHGGNILASEERNYADMLDSADLENDVRLLMEGLHKSMLKRLKRGDCDPVIEERLGTQAFSPSDTDATLPPAELQEPEKSAPPPAKADETSGDRIARAFGQGVVSQKPLDEVVLEYLVENARKRKRAPK